MSVLISNPLKTIYKKTRVCDNDELTIFCCYSYTSMSAEAYTGVLFKPLIHLDVPAESQDRNLSSEQASTQFQSPWDWATPSTYHIFTNPCTGSGQPLMPITKPYHLSTKCAQNSFFWKGWHNRGTELCIQEPFQDKLNENHNRGKKIIPQMLNQGHSYPAAEAKPGDGAC